MASQQPQHGPPYPPQGASLGGLPTTGVDVPICAVLIALFITGAAGHMTVFQLNRRRSHKFVLSGLVFGFCMARITANVLRIVWATRPTNARVAIAASVFTNAGVVLLFVVNLIFTQRILRAYHPRIGWSKPGSLIFKFLFVSVVANLIMVITAVVYSFYTLDVGKRQKIRDVQLTGTVYFAVLAGLPLIVIAVCLLLPRKAPMDKFGQGRMRTKIYLLLFTSTLLALGAGFRAGVAFQKRPANDPAWFHHKACYFCFNYVIELIVVFSYLTSRFDRRFHIPNGSSKAGDYSSSIDTANSQKIANNINTEEEVFGDSEPPRTAEQQRDQEQDWERNLKSELKKETV
ncbi:Fc.00g088760.m01.CDS01 [Cosmosporella sp. VM-42]